jgi:hypothetical protein
VLVNLGAVLFVGTLVWASDRITLQGERTIFTANCEHGEWVDGRCTGRLVPGDRYAFRASVGRQEVLYWIRGARSPYGKLSDCKVKDRDNWTCTVPTGSGSTMTQAMIGGQPTSGCADLPTPLHRIAKWRWWAMKLAATLFTPERG